MLIFRLFIFILLAQTAFGQFNEGVSRVNYYQLNANHALNKVPTATTFNLKYYIVPKSMTEIITEEIPENLLNLIKEDQDHMRWFIHPKDEYHHFKIKNFLVENNLDATTHELKIKADMTESRSSFLQDLKTPQNNQYSLRLSFTKGLGHWGGEEEAPFGTTYTKGIDINDAKWAQFLSHKSTQIKDRNLLVSIQPEVATIAFNPSTNIDSTNFTAYSIRDISDFANTNKRFLPSYASYHEKTGSIIATLNNSLNPIAFWAKNEARSRAMASVDLLLDYKIVMSSIHSQNYLREFDVEYKPMRKVVVRDIGDSFIPPGIHDAYNVDELNKMKQLFPERVGMHEKFDNINQELIPLAFSWTHGSNRLNHIGEDEEANFKKIYIDSFIQRLSERTGIKPSVLEKITSVRDISNSYHVLMIDSNTTAWKNILKMMKEKSLIYPQPKTQDEPRIEFERINKLSLGEKITQIPLNPLLMSKVFLIDYLDHQKQISQQTLKVFEQEWAKIQPSIERKFLTQSLIIMGSQQESVLADYLTHGGSFYYQQKTIEALQNKKKISLKSQIALASLSLDGSNISSANTTLIDKTIKALTKHKPTDSQVLLAAWKRAGSNFSKEALQAFSKLQDIPDQIINEVMASLRDNYKNKQTYISFNYNYRYKLIAQDKRTWDFFENKWEALTSYRENNSHIIEAKALIKKLRRSRRCNFLFSP